MNKEQIIKFFKEKGYSVNDKLTQVDFVNNKNPNSTCMIHYAQFSEMTEEILNGFILQDE